MLKLKPKRENLSFIDAQCFSKEFKIPMNIIYELYAKYNSLENIAKDVQYKRGDIGLISSCD